jgi:PKD repeat protein
MKKRFLFMGVLILFFLLNACDSGIEACFAETITGRDVLFNATCSNSATSYEWKFGDGASSKLAGPSHTYAAAGSYTVVLEAFNKNGKSDTYSKTITVQ